MPAPFSAAAPVLPSPPARYDPEEQAQFRREVERAIRDTKENNEYPALYGEIYDSGGAVVNVMHPKFGAVGDGTTDDTAALQAATDACLATTPIGVLFLPGRHLITSSLNIDRKIYDPYPTAGSGIAEGYFRVVGAGPQAGIYTTTAIDLIDTTLASGVVATSQLVTFENVHFEADDNTLAAHVLSGNFIRMKFIGCSFNKMKLISSTDLSFSYHFSRCIINDFNGTFFDLDPSTPSATDIVFVRNLVQSGGVLFETGLIQQIQMVGNVIELLTGRVLDMVGCRGGVISGNYNELVATGAATEMYRVSNGLAPAGLAIHGNFFAGNAAQIADSGFYAIDLGSAEGVSILGNYCNTRLFTFTPQAGVLVEIHAAANYELSLATSSPLYGSKLSLTGRIGDGFNYSVYDVNIAQVTALFSDELFDASATTDSKVIWQQPAHTMLIGCKIVLDIQFAAPSMTDLRIEVGDADPNGLLTGVQNYTSASPTTTQRTRGVLWDGTTVTEIYSAVAKDWTAFATSTGADLDALTAGSMTFYFAYRGM